MSDYNHGDRVKVTLENKELSGTLIKKPEILKDDTIILKFDSGYNIGILKKKIKKITLIKKQSKKLSKPVNIKHKKNLKNISILSTGGTISSKVDYKTGGTIADYTAVDLIQMMPELEDLANLKAKKIMSIMSEDMHHEHWIKITKVIEKEFNQGADGVIITQGTDTLHYTAAALSFFFHDIKKPIILTASQRSIDRGSSDAFMNLVSAVNAAANFDGGGVYTCMHGSSNDDYCDLIKGCKVRKMHTSRRDAFRPINTKPIAKIYKDKEIKIISKDYIKKDLKSIVNVDASFEEKIGLLTIYPLIDPGLIDFFIKNKYKGLVLAATALGHVPSVGKYDLQPILKKAKDAGMTIIIASQTIYGSVHEYVYTNLRKLSIGLDLIFAKDMTPETAFVKLGYVLGKTKDKDKIKKLYQKNIAGEYNDNISELEYLN